MHFSITQERNSAHVAVALDAQIFVKDEHMTIEEAERTVWWIARDESGQPVAYAGARAIPKQRLSYLVRAGVLPSARGHGLQRRLIRCRVNWSAKQNAAAAITYTIHTNYPSSNNLIHSGFRMYSPDWLWVGKEVLYWWKDL